MNAMLTVLMPVLTLGIGYVLGVAKFFRQEKQRAYVELLPTILKAAYNPKPADEEEFCRALSKLWLYANKDVAKKMDTAVGILHDETRGDKTKAFQSAISAMRSDIQWTRLLRWQGVKPEDVKHLYSRIGGATPSV